MTSAAPPAPQFSQAVTPIPSAAQAVSEGNVEAMIQIFTAWREKLPDVKETARGIVDKFAFPPRLQKIILAAADLAAEPNNNPFHGNEHFLEVFTSLALLAKEALDQGQIDQQTLALLLTAALIHDYKHDGGINGSIQYRLEKIAVDSAEPALRSAGATDEDMAIIRAFVYATDVSKDFSNSNAVSPAESVNAYNHSKNPDDLKPELRILHVEGLSNSALMLRDADIGPGLISVDLNIDGGKRLAQEQGRSFDPNGQSLFLKKICHCEAFSQSGRALFTPYLSDVLKHFGVEEPKPNQALSLG